MTKTVTNDVETYNVICMDCDCIFNPEVNSRFWWMAKKHAESGKLDALRITGKQCGCAKKVTKPDAPYRVIGYDFDCHDYDIPFYNFTGAVQKYRELNRRGDVVFISGVSDRVKFELGDYC